MNRRIQEIIQDQKLATMSPTHSVKEACTRMQEKKIGAVLVVDTTGTLVGIFTGRDAVRCLASFDNPSALSLDQVMTSNPASLPPHATAIEALRLMRDGGFRHVPILEGQIVQGILSNTDFRGLEQDRLDEEVGLWERI